MANAPPPKKKRSYTFCCVFYGNHNDLITFLKNAKHFFYAYHDKDTTDSHYHIYCTFATNKSFASVRALNPSQANLLVQEPLGTAIEMRDYFAHFPTEQYPNKFHYGYDIITYDDNSYWSKVFKDDNIPNEKNQEFLDDLLKVNFRLEDMAVKYGKDFIKNCEKYVSFRYFVLREREIDIRNALKDCKDNNLYKKGYIDL